MGLEINKTYKFRLSVNGQDLVYTGTITDIDNNFITFTDKFDAILTYNISTIVSYEEVEK